MILLLINGRHGKALFQKEETQLLRNEVLDWFGNKAQFIKAHMELTKYYYESDISIED